MQPKYQYRYLFETQTVHALSKTFRRMANLPRSNVAEGPKEGFIRFDMPATKTPTRLALRPSPIREMRPTQAEELRRRVLVGVGRGVLYVCGGVAADNVDSCDSPDCDAVRTTGISTTPAQSEDGAGLISQSARFTLQAPAGEQLAHPGGIHYMANPHLSYCPVHARKGRQLS